MFEFNAALHCIEEPESDVVEIYQSAPLSLALNGTRAEKRTAYVCAIKKKTKVQVYVALASRHGQIAVYTRVGSQGRKNSDDSIDEGLQFASSMGFDLEPVNLDYSPALREVILKGFKIFNQPLPASPPPRAGSATLVSPTPSAPAAGTGPEGGSSQSAPSAAPSAARSAAAAASAASAAEVARVAAASAAPAAVLAAITDHPDREAALANGLGELRQEVESLRAERDDLRTEVQEVAADLQKGAAALDIARQEVARLSAERENLVDSALLQTASAESADLREQVARLVGQLDEANSCNKAFVEEARHRSEQEAAHRDALSTLTREVEGVAKERDALLARVEELSALHLSATTALQEAKAEIGKVTAERESLARSASGLEESSLELATLRQEVAALRQEHAVLTQQREEAVRRCADLEEEGRTRWEQEAATAKAEADLNALLKRQLEDAERRYKELSAANAALLQAAEDSQEGSTRVAAERDAALSRAAELATEREAAACGENDLRQELLSLSTDRAAAQARIEKLLEESAAKDAALEAMRKETAALRAERQTLLRSAAERLQSLERVEAELAASKAHPAQAEAAPPPAQVAPPERSEAAPPFSGFIGAQDRYHAFLDMTEPADAEAEATAFLPLGAGGLSGSTNDTLCPGFPADGDAAPVLFLLQPGETAIRYATPDDVVAVHRSTNFANMAPEGKGQESCQGYICCVKERDGVRVYLAIFGKESGKTRVYHPEAHPADDGGVAATLAGAVGFAEQVGLMMEQLTFSSDDQRRAYIGNCPVLGRTEEACKLKKSA